MQCMKCGDCGQDILQQHPQMCPYCRSKNLIADEDALKEAKRLAGSGRYEEAALEFEKMDLWEDARECRKQARKNHSDNAVVETAKIGAINVICPHCNTSQPVASKSEDKTCSHCGVTFKVPKEAVDLVNFE